MCYPDDDLNVVDVVASLYSRMLSREDRDYLDWLDHKIGEDIPFTDTEMIDLCNMWQEYENRYDWDDEDEDWDDDEENEDNRGNSIYKSSDYDASPLTAPENSGSESSDYKDIASGTKMTGEAYSINDKTYILTKDGFKREHNGHSYYFPYSKSIELIRNGEAVKINDASPLTAPENSSIDNHTKYYRDGFDKYGYNPDGYNKDGWTRKGINYATLSRFDDNGFNENGFDVHGYNKEGFDKDGVDKYGFNKNTYDIDGYDKEGFDKDDFNRYGFNRTCDKKYIYANMIGKKFWHNGRPYVLEKSGLKRLKKSLSVLPLTYSFDDSMELLCKKYNGIKIGEKYSIENKQYVLRKNGLHTIDSNTLKYDYAHSVDIIYCEFERRKHKQAKKIDYTNYEGNPRYTEEFSNDGISIGNMQYDGDCYE